jgi:hypothetical protein
MTVNRKLRKGAVKPRSGTKEKDEAGVTMPPQTFLESFSADYEEPPTESAREKQDSRKVILTASHL